MSALRMAGLGDVGQAIKLLRVAHKRSRKQLAVRAGVGLSTIYILEAGDSLPTFALLSKLLAALGADRYDLLNALLGLGGEPHRRKLPARSGDHPRQRELLDLLDLDLPPVYEAAFLGMLGDLRDAFLAESPAPGNRGPSILTSSRIRS